MHYLGTLYMGVVTEQSWVPGDGAAASSLGFQTLRSSSIDWQQPLWGTAVGLFSPLRQGLPTPALAPRPLTEDDPPGSSLRALLTPGPGPAVESHGEGPVLRRGLGVGHGGLMLIQSLCFPEEPAGPLVNQHICSSLPPVARKQG